MRLHSTVFFILLSERLISKATFTKNDLPANFYEELEFENMTYRSGEKFKGGLGCFL